MMRVFVGFDGSEAAAYWILRRSILKHAANPAEVRVIPIVRQLLAMNGVHDRPIDPLASTEFTYTRFLTPWLAGFRGWALFMDCDILVRGDIARVFAHADPQYAVLCVKHDHKPVNTDKMGGKQQTVYPRKNWSSVVLFNCGHPSNRVLSPDLVNEQSGAFLHRFQWLTDEEIGDLTLEWNWLDGWNSLDECAEPLAVHYTDGIPGIHPGFEHAAFADEYRAVAAEVIPAVKSAKQARKTT